MAKASISFFIGNSSVRLALKQRSDIRSATEPAFDQTPPV
jgi:hypothetical protein